jgi:hypothetical protein
LCDTEARDSTPPSVDADGLGRSAPTKDLNVGCAAAPVVGPAKTLFAVCVARVSVNVPEEVTGLPDMLNIGDVLASEKETDVTVPEPLPLKVFQSAADK